MKIAIIAIVVAIVIGMVVIFGLNFEAADNLNSEEQPVINSGQENSPKNYIVQLDEGLGLKSP